MTTWNICHKSGRVLFTTNDERTAMNRAKYGWRVEKADDCYEIAKQQSPQGGNEPPMDLGDDIPF